MKCAVLIALSWVPVKNNARYQFAAIYLVEGNPIAELMILFWALLVDMGAISEYRILSLPSDRDAAISKW